MINEMGGITACGGAIAEPFVTFDAFGNARGIVNPTITARVVREGRLVVMIRGRVQACGGGLFVVVLGIIFVVIIGIRVAVVTVTAAAFVVVVVAIGNIRHVFVVVVPRRFRILLIGAFPVERRRAGGWSSVVVHDGAWMVALV
jgi:hypothetical protein